ncbi:hypothetical protein [Modestobacter lapidis]|nr:hypothetical protein [Modestobacter lapidis]
MLIDCDTCTVRGDGCADCVVTVLLGAPPGWQETGPTVVPLTRRVRSATGEVQPATVRADAPDAPGQEVAFCDVPHLDSDGVAARPVVELDDVERRAVRALADFGLVPPLRHQDASLPAPPRQADGDRHVS